MAVVVIDNNDIENALQSDIDAAVADLIRLLGYPLCTEETILFEERIFTFDKRMLWQRTHPFYAIQSVTIVRDGVEEVVTSYQLGQNGQLTGDWFNMLKLCDRCNVKRCSCNESCDYIKVVAKWGFGPNYIDNQEQVHCFLPDDLKRLLVDVAKQYHNPSKDIQSESLGTRSYTKFSEAAQSVWDRNTDIVNFYKYKKPSFV